MYMEIISVDLAHHEIFRAKVGKGGIRLLIASPIPTPRVLAQWS